MKNTGFLLDANVWIALLFRTHSFHEAALEWSKSSRGQKWIFCRSTQQSFLRLSSTPALLKACDAEGWTNRDSLNALAKFLAAPQVEYRLEPENLELLWNRFGVRDTASPNVWMDAYLAAFAISANLQLVTFDSDFLSYRNEGLAINLLS